MEKLYKLLTIFILTTYYLILTTSLVTGQSVDLGVYPPILQVMIQPGKSLTQVYKVNNFGDPSIVTSGIMAFTASGEKGNVSLIDCSQVELLSCESRKWFTLQNADYDLGSAFFLGTGRTQEIILKIAVPENAAEGDYYNTLLFTTQAPPGIGEKRSRAEASIGSNILLTVSKTGNPTRNISIIEFSASKVIKIIGKIFKVPLFDSFGTIPVNLKVANKGSAYVSVSGKLTLNGFPGLKSNFTIPSQNILASSTRLLTATPSANLSANTLMLPKGFYLGRYTLETNLENEDGQKIQARTSFFALPLVIVLFAVFGIIAYFFFSHLLTLRKD